MSPLGLYQENGDELKSLESNDETFASHDHKEGKTKFIMRRNLFIDFES